MFVDALLGKVINDDELSSSSSSFAIVSEKHNNGDDGASTNATLSEEASQKPIISQIAKVSYQDFFVGIYSPDLAEMNSLRPFFFEPIFLLDTTSISSGSHGLLKQDYVKFTIQMWNPELRSKVLNRLTSLPCLKDVAEFQEDDVYVMPYEEVKLIFKSTANKTIHSIRLMDEPIAYTRLSQNLEFYLLCESSSFANDLAEDFRKNPEFTLRNLKLAIECRGLIGPSGLPMSSFKSSTFAINVPAISFEHRQEYDLQFKDLQEKIELITTRCSTNVAIPVFSVKRCSNPKPAQQESISFAFVDLDIETNTEHGDFDLQTGIFSVKTTGIYDVKFTAHVQTNKWTKSHRIDLRVDGVYKAVSYTQTSSDNEEHRPIIISAVLPLKCGEKVSIVLVEGGLYENQYHVARFTGVLLAGQH